MILLQSSESSLAFTLFMTLCCFIGGILTIYLICRNKIKHKKFLFENFGEKPKEFHIKLFYTIYIIEAAKIISFNGEWFTFSEIDYWQISRTKVRCGRRGYKNAWQIEIGVKNPYSWHFEFVSTDKGDLLKIEKILQEIMVINKLSPIPVAST